MVGRLVKCFAFITLMAALVSAQDEPRKTNSRPEPVPMPTKADPFDKADVKTMSAQCVRLDTEAGVIEIELYPEQAPETVRNFLNLVVTGSYDTTTFSRVVPGFVIQGGNLTTREGAWTYELAARAKKTIPDEPNKILHQPGVVSMARPDEPNSATTHFFILLKDAPELDGKFAAFGRVTKGMEVVEAISKGSVTGEKPDKPVRLRKSMLFPCLPK